MTTALFAYTAALTRTREGTVMVAFPDLPEALTEGNDEEDALKQAIDCLDEAIAGRIADREDIPTPTAEGRYVVLVPALTAAKAALYLAMREVGISNVKLAKRLGLDERQVRRLLDPSTKSRMPEIERALAELDQALEVRVVPAVRTVKKPPAKRVARNASTGKVVGKKSAARRAARQPEGRAGAAA